MVDDTMTVKTVLKEAGSTPLVHELLKTSFTHIFLNTGLN